MSYSDKVQKNSLQRKEEAGLKRQDVEERKGELRVYHHEANTHPLVLSHMTRDKKTFESRDVSVSHM